MSKKKPDLSEIRERLKSKNQPQPDSRPVPLSHPLLNEMADILAAFIEPVSDKPGNVFNKDEPSMIVGAKVTGSLSKDSRIIIVKVDDNFVPDDVPHPEIWICLKMAGKFAKSPVMHWKNTQQDVLNYSLSDQAMRAALKVLEEEHSEWLERYYSLEVI